MYLFLQGYRSWALWSIHLILVHVGGQGAGVSLWCTSQSLTANGYSQVVFYKLLWEYSRDWYLGAATLCENLKHNFATTGSLVLLYVYICIKVYLIVSYIEKNGEFHIIACIDSARVQEWYTLILLYIEACLAYHELFSYTLELRFLGV